MPLWALPSSEPCKVQEEQQETPTSLPGILWFLAKTSHKPQGRQDKLETKHAEGVKRHWEEEETLR